MGILLIYNFFLFIHMSNIHYIDIIHVIAFLVIIFIYFCNKLWHDKVQIFNLTSLLIQDVEMVCLGENSNKKSNKIEIPETHTNCLAYIYIYHHDHVYIYSKTMEEQKHVIFSMICRCVSNIEESTTVIMTYMYVINTQPSSTV